MQGRFALAAMAAMGSVTAVTAVTPLSIPSADDAKAAIMQMWSDPALVTMLKAGRVKIGTCRKVFPTQRDNEIACTFAFVAGAGSSESQANFYRDNGKWVATPTTEKLPFPDPALM